MKRAHEFGDQVVGTTALASVLGMRARHVNDLARQGILEPEGKGKWRLGHNVQRLLAHRAAAAADDGDGSPEFKAEQARLYKARADMAELEARRKAGELVPVAQVEAALADVIVTARNHIAAMPSKAAARFPNPAAALPLLEDASRDALDSLADREVERVVGDACTS